MFDPVQRISRDLPNAPQEVIETWLAPLARTAGWPPTILSRWQQILLERPLSFWQQLEWSKTRVLLSSWSLEQRSLAIAQGLIDANVHGIRNAYSEQISDTQERFNRILSYIRFHGSLPVPPVLLKQGSLYRVADGNHRVAAWLAANPSSILGPECWVASRPAA
jgi:hypothetical protein